MPHGRPVNRDAKGGAGKNEAAKGPTGAGGKKHDRHSGNVGDYKLIARAAPPIVFALVGLKAFGKNRMSR